jgi:hypothetical protein
MRWNYSRAAGLSLGLWVAATAVCGVLVISNPRSPWGNLYLTEWETKHAAAFWYWCLLFAFSFGIHAWDARSLTKSGSAPWGFKYVRSNGIRARHDLSEGVIRAMLTIQSIRAAITIGMLFTVVNIWRQSANGNFRAIFATPFSETLRGTLASPASTMGALVLAALICSITTTLAAIQCYDYSIRYDWLKAGKPLAKQALVGKAHGFTRYGFYSLMAALTASVMVVEPALSIFTTMVVFLAMWKYYYFYEPTTAVPEAPASAPSPSVATTVARNPVST